MPELTYSSDSQSASATKQVFEDRLWMDSTLSKFDETLRINYDKTVEEFADIVISESCEIIDAISGAFFIVDEDNQVAQADNMLIRAVAGYGCTIDSMSKSEFRLGEGIVGQVAKSKKARYLENIPAQSVIVPTALGGVNAISMICLPLMFNDKVYGILEFVCIQSLEDKFHKFLNRLCKSIASTLQSIQTNMKTRELLKTLQEEATKRLAQEEELRQNLEELQATQDAMKRSQQELEELKEGLEIKVAQQTEELQKLLARFNLAAATTTEGLWDLEIPANGELIDETPFWWADNFRYMLGYSDEKDFPNILSSWSDLLHPDHKERTLQAFHAHLFDITGKTPYDVEYQLKRKTGEYRWYRAVGNTLRDDSGKPLRVAGSLIDIQGQKDLEALKDESMERFDLAAATTTEGLWDLKIPADEELTDETPFWWADNFRHMLGYSDEKDFPNILSSWSDLLHPDHKEKTLQAFHAHLFDITGKTPYDVEYQLKRKTGEYRWYRAVGNTLRNDSGKPLRVAGSLIDIQGQKDLEALKDESVERFDLAAATTTEGLWDLKIPANGELTDETPFWWANNFRYMLGYFDEKDFPNILSSWSDLLHPDHKEKTLQAFHAHLFDFTGKTPYDVEYQLKRKTGEYRWYRAVGNTLRDVSGKPLRVAGSLIDIQGQKDLEALKNESVERFNLAAATTTEGLWDLKIPADGELTDETPFWWADNFRYMLGYSDEKDFPNILSSWSDLLHPDHKEKTLQAFHAHLFDFTGKTPYDVEYQLKRKTGEYRWYQAVGNTLRDVSGKPLRVAGSLIDIQGQKDLEALKDESVERFELAAATTTEGLWDLKIPTNGELTDETPFWWADNFRYMLGYSDEKDFPNILSSWSDLLHPDHKEKTLQAFHAHLFDFTGKTPYDVEYQLKRKTGEYRWYRAVGNTLRDDSGKPLRVAGSLIDIQGKKDHEDLLQKNGTKKPRAPRTRK